VYSTPNMFALRTFRVTIKLLIIFRPGEYDSEVDGSGTGIDDD
jgi:hypothetical protein